MGVIVSIGLYMRNILVLILSTTSLYMAAHANVSTANNISVAIVTNLSKAHTSTPGRQFSSDPKATFGAALLYESAAPTWTYEAGLLYIDRSVSYGSYYTESAKWLQVPLLLRLRLSQYSVGLGGYLAHALGEVQRDYESSSVSVDYTELERKKMDYGLATAFAWQPGRFFLEARYNYGLANLYDGPANEEYTYSDLQLLGGVRF